MNDLDQQLALSTKPSSTLGKALAPLTLKVRSSKGTRDFVVNTSKCSIGAAASCQIRMDLPGIQPVHCVIFRGPQRTIVRRWAPDTWLNDEAFLDAELKHGDTIRIKDISLTAEFEGASAVDLPAVPNQNRRNSQIHGLVDRLHLAERRVVELESYFHKHQNHASSISNRIKRVERMVQSNNNRKFQQLFRRLLNEKSALEREIGAERIRFREERFQLQSDLDRVAAEMARQAEQLQYEKQRNEANAERLAEFEITGGPEFGVRFAELTRAREELTKSHLELSQRCAEIEALRIIKERALADRTAELNSAQRRLSQVSEELNQERQQAADASSQLQSRIHDLEQQLVKQQDQCETGKAELAEARAALATHQHDDDQRVQLEQQVEQLTAECQALTTQCDNLRDKLEALQQETANDANSYLQQIEALEQQVEQQSQEWQARELDLQETIARLEDALQHQEAAFGANEDGVSEEDAAATVDDRYDYPHAGEFAEAEVASHSAHDDEHNSHELDQHELALDEIAEVVEPSEKYETVNEADDLDIDAYLEPVSEEGELDLLGELQLDELQIDDELPAASHDQQSYEAEEDAPSSTWFEDAVNSSRSEDFAAEVAAEEAESSGALDGPAEEALDEFNFEALLAESSAESREPAEEEHEDALLNELESGLSDDLDADLSTLQPVSKPDDENLLKRLRAMVSGSADDTPAEPEESVDQTLNFEDEALEDMVAHAKDAAVEQSQDLFEDSFESEFEDQSFTGNAATLDEEDLEFESPAEESPTDAASLLAKLGHSFESEAPAEQPPVAAAAAALSQHGLPEEGLPNSEDVSIEDYMQQLLQRVGTPGSAAAPPPAASQRKESLTVLMEEQQKQEQAEEQPRIKNALNTSSPDRERAPQPVVDLEAMRELANESTRNALSRHAKKSTEKDAMSKLSTSIIAILVAAILMILSRGEMSYLFMGGMVAMIIAVLFGYRAFQSGAGRLFLAITSGRTSKETKDAQKKAKKEARKKKNRGAVDEAEIAAALQQESQE